MRTARRSRGCQKSAHPDATHAGSSAEYAHTCGIDIAKVFKSRSQSYGSLVDDVSHGAGSAGKPTCRDGLQLPSTEALASFATRYKRI